MKDLARLHDASVPPKQGPADRRDSSKPMNETSSAGAEVIIPGFQSRSQCERANLKRMKRRFSSNPLSVSGKNGWRKFRGPSLRVTETSPGSHGPKISGMKRLWDGAGAILTGMEGSSRWKGADPRRLSPRHRAPSPAWRPFGAEGFRG